MEKQKKPSRLKRIFEFTLGDLVNETNEQGEKFILLASIIISGCGIVVMLLGIYILSLVESIFKTILS